MTRDYVCPDCESPTEKIKCSGCGKYSSEEDAIIHSLIGKPIHVKGDDNSSPWVDFIPLVLFIVAIVVVVVFVIVG